VRSRVTKGTRSMHNLATTVVVRACKRHVILWLALGLIATCSTLLAGPFFDYQVISGNIVPLERGVSINNEGNVAFIGQDAQGRGAFLVRWDSANKTWLAPELVAHGSFKDIWLNDANDVAMVYQAISGSRPMAGVERFSKSTGTWTATIIAKGDTAKKPITINLCPTTPPYDCPYTIYQRIEPFDYIFTPVSINDSGTLSFVAGLDSRFYIAARSAYSKATTPSLILNSLSDIHPIVINDGRVLINSGLSDNSGIVLYNSDFTPNEIVAAPNQGFTRIGRNPGTSSDGKVVAFFGNLSDSAKAKQFTEANRDIVPLPVTTGSGILASVSVNGTRHMVRVAGQIRNAAIDPGERWVKTANGSFEDRGQDYNFSGSYEYSSLVDYPFDWEITSFDADAAISVSSAKAFEDQKPGRYFLVCYAATDLQGNTGIYTSRVNVFLNPSDNSVASVGVEAPLRVIKVSDPVQNLGTVNGLITSDSVNSNGQVAFFASSGATARIVVGNPTSQDAVRSMPRFDPDSPIIEFVVAADDPKQPGDTQREYPSPELVCPGVNNGDPRNCFLHSSRSPTDITQVILHATAGNERDGLASRLGRCRDCQDECVSIHYMVSREGRVIEIVKEKDVAYHAAHLDGSTSPSANLRSIGIELVDDGVDKIVNGTKIQIYGHTVSKDWLTSIQRKKAALLVRDIVHRELIPSLHLSYEYPVKPFEQPVPLTAGTPPGGGQSGIIATTRGIIGHGQVLDRRDSKTDPQIFDWPEFMCMVNKGIGLTLNSPANLLVTDPQGRRTGYDSIAGQTLLEIPGSQFSGPGTEPQSLSIPDATNGNYTIQVVGTSNGVFHLDIYASGQDAGLTRTRVAGSTSLGAVTSYTMNHDAVSGEAAKVSSASNLPPVTFDDFAQTVTNQPVVINVLANDNDPDAFLNTNSVTIVTNPANGTVSVNATNGIITYMPANGFLGTNIFAYTVRDNEGALSDPGLVTVTVTASVLTTNAPPIASADFGATTNGNPVTIDVLANDSAPDGILDPATVTLTWNPTNGTASVDSFTGAITYTPNLGTTNRDTFRYTVRDDLGTVSLEATVTITNVVIQAGVSTAPEYLVLPASQGPSDHRYPRINNSGDIVYQNNADGLWQVWKKSAGDPTFTSASQITFPDAQFTDATSPGISDFGSIVCYRHRTNGGQTVESIVTYPGAAIVANGVRRDYPQAEDWLGPYTSISSDGKQIWASTHYPSGIDPPPPTGNLFISGRGSVFSQQSYIGFNCDVNAQGEFVYGNGSQIFLNNVLLGTGQFPNINDVPRGRPDIVYANGSNLISRVFGRLQSGQPNELTGGSVDVNKDGILVFERLVGSHYQVFKAYPWEPRIISISGTNALVGLPYRYDSDNIAEAYGGPESENDPRAATPITWSLVSGPPGFSIDSLTGRISWIPTAAGTFTAVIRAANWNLALEDVEDLQSINIAVAQPAVQMLDAVDFRTPYTPALPQSAINYAAGGTSRIGTLADGASKLVLRVPLLGAETNAFPNLHFAISGTNQLRDGLLRAISRSAWTNDVPASVATTNGTNFALCLYESPLDFDAASNPVYVQLINGTNIIARQPIQLRRPPVVLVHDGWSNPDVWGVMIGELLDVGIDVHLVNHEFTSGNSLSANDTKIFLTGNEALALVRQSGFAASQFDLVGHGAGGILGRLHAQRYAAQDVNYRKGDVHKLITIGTPHQGSWLAATVLSLRTNNPATFASLRGAMLAASEATGYYPPVDLNGGLMDDLAPGSATLMELEEIVVPSHAIAATVHTLPPGDPVAFIHYYLGLARRGDGLVTTNSAVGGIEPNGSTVFTNIGHAFEPTDPNIVARVLALLTGSLTSSDHFATFPGAVAATDALPGVFATNAGTWLSLSGATNGQSFAPGAMVNLTAIAGGHLVQSVQFLSPAGSALVTTGAFAFSLQIPMQAVGRVVVAVAARDTNDEVAFASVALNVIPAFSLQSLSVEPSPVVFNVRADLPLRVWGQYADGIQRDLTVAGSGTKYRSSAPTSIAVTSNGVLRPFVASLANPITVSITNGSVWTNVQVTMALTNLPPTAVITANRHSGPAPLDVQFSGANSVGALNYFWDFGDGTTSAQQIPPQHTFFQSGQHVVKLAVTDAEGLLGQSEVVVAVDPILIVDNRTVSVTSGEVLFYQLVVITNGGVLRAAMEVPLKLFVTDSVFVSSNSAINLSGKGYPGGAGITNGGGPGGGTNFIDFRGGRNEGSGGSYGGIGGIAQDVLQPRKSPAYGSFTEPNDFGSGGGGAPDSSSNLPGGSGGGLIVIRTPRLRLDGVISASGEPNVSWTGSGSGGSIQLNAATVEGGGLIQANGGNATGLGGGGGGGRVAVYYDSMGGFSGLIQAKGGTGQAGIRSQGGAGTVYLKRDSDAFGELLIDNGGIISEGWTTPVSSMDTVRLKSWIILGHAQVTNSARVWVEIGNSSTFAMLMASNLLSVRALLVSNTWVYGDISKLSLAVSSGRPLVTVYGQSNVVHELQRSSNLVQWISLATNSLPSGSFQYLDGNSPLEKARAYRALRP